MAENDSTLGILEKTKNMLGIAKDDTSFDVDILTHINAAISSLKQLGVDPIDKNFIVKDNNSTYSDYLGAKEKQLVGEVSLYIFYRTKLGFDPPSNSFLVTNYEKLLSEVEFRILILADEVNKNNDGGNQNE